ncbi:hypothetical protein [Brevibacterium zhoupengii]|uniref:hypothetical protein n=1 Tax=Brevibacterium zhoupengii TaxID=2898795 RepID=UPI001F09ABC2|nr:hypothetical protein [Brevibacterium zhoupengii]
MDVPKIAEISAMSSVNTWSWIQREKSVSASKPGKSGGSMVSGSGSASGVRTFFANSAS